MSKVGGALPAWYWPEGIPRRSPVPQQTIDRLVKRACRKTETPALVWPDRTVTCGELLESTAESARRIAAMLSDDDVVAIAERDPGEALVLTLAVLQSGKRALVADLDQGPEQLAATFTRAGAKVALAAGEASVPAGVRLVTAAELAAFDGELPKLRPVKATAPALILPDGDELAVHSNYSLAAMSVAVTAFIPELGEFSALVNSPLWKWETLTAMLSALLNGATAYIAGYDEAGSLEGFDPDRAYAMLERAEVDGFAAAGGFPELLRKLHFVFVSTDYFQPKWRRQIEQLRGREVLLLWGRGAFGPAVAAHPTWFPFEAHGIPLVNVRVLPVDPNSGKPSLVPWEMLDQAEIGVESPGQMTGYVESEVSAELMSGKIMRTCIPASVDHVGVVVLHKPPKSKAKAAA
jgi:hypothetical protein